MVDISINEDFDLSFTGGDFTIGESTEQHQELLLLCNKGEWRENPDVGVGIKAYLKDEDNGGLLPEIKEQFERDGMQVNKLTQSGYDLKIDAIYK